MKRAVPREFLDSLPCQCCGDPEHSGPMFFHSRCHTSSGSALLKFEDGVTTVSCGECEKLIVEVLTAEPDFELPIKPVEVYYLKGHLHVEGHGKYRVAPDPRIN